MLSYTGLDWVGAIWLVDQVASPCKLPDDLCYFFIIVISCALRGQFPISSLTTMYWFSGAPFRTLRGLYSGELTEYEKVEYSRVRLKQ